MPEHASNLHFKLMALALRLRDVFGPPKRRLREVGIRPGDTVLDFGCGIGSYSLAGAKLVGETGKVYAADVHPLAIRAVERGAARKGLRNVETIRTDCAAPLGEASVDIVLLYDVLHEIGPGEFVLRELHRVLKAGGVLSVGDHHLKREEIVKRVTATGLFDLFEEGRRRCDFTPVER